MSASAYSPWNCWSLVTERIGYAIPDEQIIANTNDPQVGDIAIFDYDGTRHFAFIQAKLLSGWTRIEECNMPKLYGKGRCGTRNISPNTPHFVGFHATIKE